MTSFFIRTSKIRPEAGYSYFFLSDV